MISSFPVLIGVLAVTSIAACLLVLHMVWGRPRLSAFSSRLMAAMLGGALSLSLIGEFLSRAAQTSNHPVEFTLESLLVAAFAAISTGLFLSTSAWLRPGKAAARQPIVWFVLLLTMGTSGWSYLQLQRDLTPSPLVAIDPISRGELHVLRDVYALTDRGRAIELFRWEEKYANDEQLVRIATPANGGVLRAQPSEDTNCHGWVFAAGKHFVSGKTVQQILDDNGYSLVKDPQPGDLVVYRDNQHEILHTALVRGRLDDGTVLVESKFGVGPRFLHLPQDQPYSKSFEYYHTKRGQHLLAIHKAPRHLVASHRSCWPTMAAGPKPGSAGFARTGFGFGGPKGFGKSPMPSNKSAARRTS